MKTLILILFFTSTLFAQNNNLSVGIEVAPMLHTKEVRNLQELTSIPAIKINYGSDHLKGSFVLGAVCRFGFTASDKWTYAGAYYMVNALNLDKIEQGAEIEAGFNCKVNSTVKFSIGSAIGLMVQGRDSKLTLRPVIIGFSVNLLNK